MDIEILDILLFDRKLDILVKNDKNVIEHCCFCPAPAPAPLLLQHRSCSAPALLPLLQCSCTYPAPDTAQLLPFFRSCPLLAPALLPLLPLLLLSSCSASSPTLLLPCSCPVLTSALLLLCPAPTLPGQPSYCTCPPQFGSLHHHQHITTFFGTARAAFYSKRGQRKQFCRDVE